MAHRDLRLPSSSVDVAQRRTLAVVAVVCALAALLVFVPSSVSLILASWFALLTRPFMMMLARRLHGRTGAAAVVTSLVVIAVLGPVVGALIPVATSTVQLATDLGKSQQWRDAAGSIIGDGAGDVDWMQLFRDHVSSAWGAVSMVLNTSATALFGIAMFIVGLFSFSADGEKTLGWLRDHSPLKQAHFDRLAGAYAETGRGILVGVGVTALVQGVLATATYAAVGISRALALGLLTTVGALIPGVGTLLVWGPVALILLLGGYPVRAAIVVGSGVILIGSIDNFLKPILSHRAHLALTPVMVFITMLSGIVAFGPAGLLLGPLFVRVAVEALAIARDERLVGAAPGAPGETEERAEPPPSSNRRPLPASGGRGERRSG